MNVMMLDWKLLVLVFQNFDAQFVACYDKRLIGSAIAPRKHRYTRSFPGFDRFLHVLDGETDVVDDGTHGAALRRWSTRCLVQNHQHAREPYGFKIAAFD